MLQAGDRVRHQRVPEWGLGQVVETRPGYVTIFFVGGGRKQFRADSPDLTPVEAGEAADPLLDNLLGASPKGGRFLTPEQGVAKFQRRYGAGFQDPRYLAEEREPRVRAHQLAVESLDQAALEGLLADGDAEEVAARARKLIGATNLVFPSEKAALNGALKEADNRAPFGNALAALLYGDGPYRERFEAFVACLKDMGAAKWTVATYFPFLRFPETHMFVKPTVTQAAAQAFAFDLKYAAEPNWATYEAALRLSDYLKDRIGELKPRDHIDIQSFLGCIAQRDKPAPGQAAKAQAAGDD